MKPENRIKRIHELEKEVCIMEDKISQLSAKDGWTVDESLLYNGIQDKRQVLLQAMGEHLAELLKRGDAELVLRSVSDATGIVKAWINERREELLKYVNYPQTQGILVERLRGYVELTQELSDYILDRADWAIIGYTYWFGWDLHKQAVPRSATDPTEVVKAWIDSNENTYRILIVRAYPDTEELLAQEIRDCVEKYSDLEEGCTEQADWEDIGIHYWHSWGFDD